MDRISARILPIVSLGFLQSLQEWSGQNLDLHVTNSKILQLKLQKLPYHPSLYKLPTMPALLGEHKKAMGAYINFNVKFPRKVEVQEQRNSRKIHCGS
jgi:hypothetical protein